MPDGMREEIAASAMANGRTMNAEIILRLSGDGETMRDRFAGHALAGVMRDSAIWDSSKAERFDVAVRMYAWADAMLAARKAGA